MYAKVFNQIFDSSIASDYRLRRMFVDMLVLADPTGVVDMTYDAISRRTGVPIEEVHYCITKLMEPDPASRSGRRNGARLAFIDPGRDWGWQIVNYKTYRKMRDSEQRQAYKRAYMRPYMREKRAAKETEKGQQGSANCELELLNRNGAKSARLRHKPTSVRRKQSNSVDFLSENQLDVLDTVRPGKTQGDAEEEEEGEERKTPLPSPQGETAPVAPAVGHLTSAREAKQIICARILNGRDPTRPWSDRAAARLLKLCRGRGLPIYEVERIAWYRQLPKEEAPDRRDPLTETGLMEYWGDEFIRAELQFQKKSSGGADVVEPTGEPRDWREFMRWSYGENVVLPDRFAQLPSDAKENYSREFETFQAATKNEQRLLHN